jgi:myo-inositol-1(or 4)-monophosphatase
MESFNDITKFLLTLSEKATEIMLKYYSPSGGVNATFKDAENNDMSPVTKADIEINDMVITEVKTHYPDYEILGEEASTNNGTDKKLFVVDPVDGTYMFTIGCPLFVFSAAVVVNGESVSGIICNPLAKRTLIAEKGKGAYLAEENKKISVSKKSALKEAFINLAWKDVRMAEKIIEAGASPMQVYSIIEAAALVATSGFDGALFRFDSEVDIASAKVIVEEAGGKVTDIEGNEQMYDKKINGAIISNGVLHAELVSAAKEANITVWKK